MATARAKRIDEVLAMDPTQLRGIYMDIITRWSSIDAVLHMRPACLKQKANWERDNAAGDRLAAGRRKAKFERQRLKRLAEK